MLKRYSSILLVLLAACALCTPAHAGVTLGADLARVVCNAAGTGCHIHHKVVITMNTTGTSATAIPHAGIIAGVVFTPGSTAPKVGTVIKFIDPVAGDDAMGGAITTTSTTVPLRTLAYINSDYRWSLPLYGDVYINVTINDVANATGTLEWDEY